MRIENGHGPKEGERRASSRPAHLQVYLEALRDNSWPQGGDKSRPYGRKRRPNLRVPPEPTSSGENARLSRPLAFSDWSAAAALQSIISVLHFGNYLLVKIQFRFFSPLSGSCSFRNGGNVEFFPFKL